MSKYNLLSKKSQLRLKLKQITLYLDRQSKYQNTFFLKLSIIIASSLCKVQIFLFFNIDLDYFLLKLNTFSNSNLFEFVCYLINRLLICEISFMIYR